MATAPLIFDIPYKNAEMASEFGCEESSKIVVTLSNRTISKEGQSRAVRHTWYHSSPTPIFWICYRASGRAHTSQGCLSVSQGWSYRWAQRDVLDTWAHARSSGERNEAVIKFLVVQPAIRIESQCVFEDSWVSMHERIAHCNDSLKNQLYQASAWRWTINLHQQEPSVQR